MRASIIIPTHNEGNTLERTVASYIESVFGLDCEIVVANDASVDASVERIVDRYPTVRVYHNEQRLGVSPTRALGARHARGNVLVFVDAHTKPERGAVTRLIEEVESTRGEAIITPRVVSLDVSQWQIDFARFGDGYGLNLQTLECGWLALRDLRPVQSNGRQYYESPALMGAAFAISRELYAKLWGFDLHMLYWGTEDLDLGLKSWLMGHPVLHDPDIVIAHHFRDAFTNYLVPEEFVLQNQLRLARKAFTPSVWAAWLDRFRQTHQRQTATYPEGLWARAWQLFHASETSLEQERCYLHGHRVRDEFWYASHFGLEWPRFDNSDITLNANLMPRSPSPGPRIAGPSCAPGFAPSAAPLARTSSLSPSADPNSAGHSEIAISHLVEIVPNHVTLGVDESTTFHAQGTLLRDIKWTASDGIPSTGVGATFTTRWGSPGTKTVTARSPAGHVRTAWAVVGKTRI